MTSSRDPLAWMGVAREVMAFALASGTAITVWYRKRSARFWPLAYEKVEYVSSGENNGTWLTDITYSYSVANEFYSGQHQIKTYSERKADAVVARWKDQNVGVRYSPKSPDVSVVRIEDQAGLHPGEFRGH
ncbi:MAG: hypothetical protein WA800_13145 [Terriglobales bacterium]